MIGLGRAVLLTVSLLWLLSVPTALLLGQYLTAVRYAGGAIACVLVARYERGTA